MSIFLTVLFVLFVIRVTIRFVSASLRIAIGIVSLFILLFVAAIVVALALYVIELFRTIFPVVAIASLVLLSVFWVRKRKKGRVYSYKSNI